MENPLGSAGRGGLQGCLERAGWWFTPECAAVCVEERVAVLADVHMGYEWARGSGGDCLPAHSLAETVAKLERLLARVPITRLVVAGDLVESSAPCRRTSADLRQLVGWLGHRGVSLEALAGNHDPAPRETLEIAGWTIAHGHRPVAGKRLMLGHHHPVLRAGPACAPCFLVSLETIVLPAFSQNAAGLDVATARLPAPLFGKALRCLASSGDEVLDFGDSRSISKVMRQPRPLPRYR
jgi:putative SbcD/Mre11-related phosphoesterase